MQLPAAQARAIARGAKTTLRIPVDSRLTAPLRPARRHSGKPFIPVAGDLLPIDSGSRTYCKIRTFERCRLGFLTDGQANLEGYDTAAEFEIDWVERHHRAWLDKQIADLIEQGEPAHQAHETRPLWARNRYEDCWANRDVWLLTVEPFDDLPYLLPGLPDEPEGIPAERISKQWADMAKRRHSQAIVDTRELDRQLLSREQRIVDLHRKAHLRGVDVSRELWLLRCRMSTLSVSSLEKHVRGIEDRIYRDAA